MIIIIIFFTKKSYRLCIQLLSLRTKQSFAICRVNIVPPAQTIKKKAEKKDENRRAHVLHGPCQIPI